MRPNKKAPLVSIRYRLCRDGYSAAGRSVPKCRTKTIGSKPVMATIKALADTGCTTMVAGMTFVRQLGLIKEDLLPVTTSIKAANKTDIVIIGAVIVEISLD